MSANALTRASTIGPMADIVEASGGSVARIFQRAELPTGLLTQPDRFILLRDQFRLLEVAARELGDHGLAFRLSSAAGMEGLGAYGAHLMSFSKLGPAITQGYAAMAKLLQSGTDMQLHVIGSHAYWSYRILDTKADGRQKNEFLALGYMLGILRLFAGPDWTPEWAEVSGRIDAKSVVEQVIGGDLRSGSSVLVVFDAELLQRENPFPKPRAHIRDEPVPDPDDMGQTVRHLIGLELMEGSAGIDRIAKRLGYTRRTLQRRLAEQGTTFERVAQSAIGDSARELLLKGDLPVTEIALALGYSDPAHFTRAFRRWTGETPAAWRRRSMQ